MSKFVAAGVIAAVGGVGAVGTGVLMSESAESAPQVSVVRVVDGDTVDVVSGGQHERIRLLNVDAPETKHPKRGVECLGPEASAYLTRLLPPGTSVTLEHDVERQDRYGRTLAGVRLDDGTLVNAMLARQGLAVPVVYGENRKFYPAVVKAREEAETNRVGFFGASEECTIPAQLNRAEATVNSAASPSAAPSDAKAATAAVTALTADLGASIPGLEVRALGASRRTSVQARVTGLSARLRGVKAARPAAPTSDRPSAKPTSTRPPTERVPRADETRPAPRTAPSRPTVQAPRRSAPQLPTRAPQPRTPQRTPQAVPSTPKPPAQDRPSNAAPCRSYAPGGKTWTPIPCP